jgi:phosphatidylserine/phosphatidylglycerophosphate/cardiolipin synthase-like enzyme
VTQPAPRFIRQPEQTQTDFARRRASIMTMLRSWGAILSLLMLAACASLPPQVDRTPTHAYTDTGNTRLGVAFRAQAAAHPGQDAFHLLSDPVDALDARVLLADRADRSLDLQYYIWHDDLTGHALADAIIRAADRGVRVRVLLDDLGTNADDRKLLEISSHPHIEIRLFNPVATREFKKIGTVLEFSRVNRRMHNKAMIADNQAAIIGGRNIGDEYFGASSMLEFGDLDVVVHGRVVNDISTEFDTFWNSPYAYSVGALVGHDATPGSLDRERERLRDYLRAMEDNPYVLEARERLDRIVHGEGTELSWGRATVLYDDPAKIARAPNDSEGHLLPQLRALALRPEHELLIVSPYLVPGAAMIERLRALTARRPRDDPDQLARIDRRRGRTRRLPALSTRAGGSGRAAVRAPAVRRQEHFEAADHRLVARVAACEDLCVRSQERVHRLDESRPALAEAQYRDRRLLREPGARGTSRGGPGAAARSHRVAGRSDDRSVRHTAPRVDSDRRGRQGDRIRPRAGSVDGTTRRGMVSRLVPDRIAAVTRAACNVHGQPARPSAGRNGAHPGTRASRPARITAVRAAAAD